jgi:hypothetical protein
VLAAGVDLLPAQGTYNYQVINSIDDSLNLNKLLAVVGLCPADEKQVRITQDNDDFCMQCDDSLHDNFDVTTFPNVKKII